MTKNQVINLLKSTFACLIGVGLHHYGGKILDKKENVAEAVAQNERDAKIDVIYNNVDYIKSTMENNVKISESLKDNIQVPTEVANQIKSKAEELRNLSQSLQDQIAASNDPSNYGDKISKMVNAAEDLKKLLESINKSGNNFLPDFNLEPFYSYLDSLTLFQESAFLNILILLFILCCIFSITSIFFGNEIIRYFDLEARFPRLSIYFKLRNTFQRYYLFWNIFLVVLAVITGILMNLLAFI